MKEVPPKDKMTFGYYLVAHIDILNQKDELRKFKGLPQTEAQRDDFVKTLKATFGSVESIRMLFDNFFEEYSASENSVPPLPVTQQKIFQELQKVEVKSQRFADTIIIYSPLWINENHKVPMHGVYATLMSCAATMLVSLIGRHVLRGGIEVGLAAEMNEGEIYGPALYEAYRLESEVAQYPRIVIGDELMCYLKEMSLRQDSDVVSQLSEQTAKRCLGLTSQDFDGHTILDYLGEGAHRAFSGTRSPIEIGKIKEFLFEQANRWKEERNTKLAFRYTLAIAYILSRVQIWSNNQSQE